MTYIFFPVVRIVAVLRPTEKNTSDRSKANSKNIQVEKNDRNERKWRKSPLLYEWWQGVLLTLVSSEWRGAIKQVSHLSIREKRIVKLDAVDNFPFSLSADSSSSSTARENEIEGKLFFPSKQPVTIGSAVRQLSAWAGRKRWKIEATNKPLLFCVVHWLIDRVLSCLADCWWMCIFVFSRPAGVAFFLSHGTQMWLGLFSSILSATCFLSHYTTQAIHRHCFFYDSGEGGDKKKTNISFLPSAENSTPQRDSQLFLAVFPATFFFIWKRESWLSLKTWHFSSERFLLLYRKMSRSCDLWT